MYKIKKTFEISASHQLRLDYDSPCCNAHGHNWRITVYCARDFLGQNGMVVDFAEIKRIVHDKLDHEHLNNVLPFNPTAENIAKWVCDNIPHCYRVDVEESENNTATYEI